MEGVLFKTKYITCLCEESSSQVISYLLYRYYQNIDILPDGNPWFLRSLPVAGITPDYANYCYLA
jgi:hypothetical protein